MGKGERGENWTCRLVEEDLDWSGHRGVGAIMGLNCIGRWKLAEKGCKPCCWKCQRLGEAIQLACLYMGKENTTGTAIVVDDGSWR